ncbi:MAG: ATP-grasp domain-containing protein [Chloroflexi bacterium]|nr:ATP-grasp domain-containing protein [Chloroflexota bacterium]MBI2980373.1 ATP-grasp domain-containing protein [Chloroflexota bacterium]
MRTRIAIIYNEPSPSHYDILHEGEAVAGVLQAVESVHQALLSLDCQVIQVPLDLPFGRAKGKLRSLDVDLVFNLFEGFSGYPETEASVPEFLAKIGIPFTGCPAAVLRLALDKAKVKVILKAAGIPTPAFQKLSPETLHTFRLGYPCIVKPRCEDASHGLSAESVVNDFVSLERQVRFICDAYQGGALVEQFISGREFNVTVLGNSEYTVLPASEIVYSLPPGMPELLTFAAKWEPGTLYYQGTNPVCPARLNSEEQQRIAETAVAVFKLLNCQGYARVDMRMSQDGEINVIELNPNADISPTSGSVRQAEAAGMTYYQFIEKIMGLALGKKQPWTSISVS